MNCPVCKASDCPTLYELGTRVYYRCGCGVDFSVDSKPTEKPVNVMKTSGTPRGGYEEYQAKMTKAFDLVANPNDWRAPVDAVVTEGALERAGVDLETVKEAVVHFTGTVPTITTVFLPFNYLSGLGYSVRAVGYRAGPCGP